MIIFKRQIFFFAQNCVIPVALVIWHLVTQLMVQSKMMAWVIILRVFETTLGFEISNWLIAPYVIRAPLTSSERHLLEQLYNFDTEKFRSPWANIFRLVSWVVHKKSTCPYVHGMYTFHVYIPLLHVVHVTIPQCTALHFIDEKTFVVGLKMMLGSNLLLLLTIE